MIWLFVYALIFVFAKQSFAQQNRIFPTTESLRTFETPHFRVIYQEPLEEAAPRLAEYCEEAYTVLHRIFGWVPDGKIDALFLDSFDTHNGWATTIPHKSFAVYLAGAEPGSSIYQPQNYLKRTIFHELTHVFTMDMSFGRAHFLSSIFGRIVPTDLLSSMLFFMTAPPAALAPRWFLEGAAIWAETEFTPPGRGRSSFADMIFRCAVRDDNLLPCSQWYIEIPHWTYGMGAYLYGMKFFEYFNDRCEWANAMGELFTGIATYAQFDIDPVLKALTGKTMDELAREMFDDETRVQLDKLARLESLETTGAPRLTGVGLSVYSPIFVGEKIYFLGEEEETRSTLYAFDPSTGGLEKISKVFSTPATGNLAVVRCTGELVLNRLDFQEQENLWYEVRRFNTKTEEESLVTDSGRYRAVDISPDGRRLVAVSQRKGKTSLVEVDLDRIGHPGAETVVTAVPLHHGLFSPRYAPDGERVSFVETGETVFSLKLFDRSTGTMDILYESNSQILMPTWHPLEDKVIFSGDMNGVFNLYEIGTGRPNELQALTHVTGGLFFPTFSPDGQTLAAVGFDGFGSYLTLIPYDPSRLLGRPLPEVGPSWKEKSFICFMPVESDQETVEDPPGEEKISEPEDYNSFSNLRFDFWSPWYKESARGLETGVMASFTDPAGYQDLKLLTGFESRYDTPIAAVHYNYKGFYPELHLYGAGEQEYFENLVIERTTSNRFDHAEETACFGTAVTVPLTRLERQLSWQAGYEYRKRNPIEDVTDLYLGRQLETLPTEEDEGLVWTKLTYLDGTAFKRSLSVEDGRLIQLAAERSAKWLGGDLKRARYLGEWNEYLSMPWLKNHVLKLSATYGKGGGDNIAQGSFTLGGLGNTITDLKPGIPDKLTVRGYPDNIQTGESVARASIAYRFPFFEIVHGSEGIVPLYTSQIFGEIYYDGGRTWDKRGDGDNLDWISSYGLEANISIKIMRYIQFAPGLGFAYIPDVDRGYRDSSNFSLYFTVKAWINF